MLVAPTSELKDTLVRGICGQVDGSIIPGMIGLEAGQSAFGDSYAWLKNTLTWPLKNLLGESSLITAEVAQQLEVELSDKLIPELTRRAEAIALDEGHPLALDWLNGRRTPDANQELKGAVTGISLGSDAPMLFKAWVEGTCFGAKAIVDRFNKEGVTVKGLIGLGGVARKSPYIMQVMADVLDMPIRIHKSEQTCALGAAMFAATAAGIYPRVEEAMDAMGQGFDNEYKPNKASTEVYQKRYQRYKSLGVFVEEDLA
jgi:L-ribulokinase